MSHTARTGRGAGNTSCPGFQKPGTTCSFCAERQLRTQSLPHLLLSSDTPGCLKPELCTQPVCCIVAEVVLCPSSLQVSVLKKPTNHNLCLAGGSAVPGGQRGFSHRGFFRRRHTRLNPESPKHALHAWLQEDLQYLEASEDAATEEFYGGGGEEKPLEHFPRLWCPNGTYSSGGQARGIARGVICDICLR